MALRMRRRGTAERVEQAAREGLERASEVATAALGNALENVGAKAPRKSHRTRNAGLAMLTLALLAAAAYALYSWWQRRREDDEFARLMGVPEEPRTSPAAPPPPAPLHSAPMPEHPSAQPEQPATVASMPASEPAPLPERPVAPSWVTPAPPANATPAPAAQPLEAPADGAARPAWNALGVSRSGAEREVPLFVLPPRPNVPFRGAATPAVDRTRLPGGGPTSFLR
jgi:hypothetical protein